MSGTVHVPPASDSVKGIVEKATQAEMEAEAADKYPSAAELMYHPGVLKRWARFNGTGTPAIVGGHNETSITDNGTGDYTVNWGNSVSNSTTGVGARQENGQIGASLAATTSDLNVDNASGTATDVAVITTIEAGAL